MKKLFMKTGLLRSLMVLLLLVTGTGQVLRAQSVTVDPNTGKLVAVLSQSDQGFENGWSGMWRHEQLPLSLTVADNTSIEAGQFSDPANNMIYYNNQLLVAGGTSYDSYLILSLPKGYRFKGYKMVLLNNLNRKTVSGVSFGYRYGNSGVTYTTRNVSKVMYETNSSFDITGNNYKARGAYDGTATYTMGGSQNDNSDTREYVITRMDETGEDMDNQLYFCLHHTNSYEDAFYAVTIKSFTIYFTAEGTFEAESKPASADVALSLVRSPFKTNKIDIGKLENQSRNGKTYFAYTYTNVRDIDAHTYIYQEDAVASGVPMNVASTKKIHPVTIGDNQYYAFENGIYYVESPTQVFSQTGLSYPIGFRIVGAKFTPQWGSAVTGAEETKTLYYITYTSGGTTYYLNDLLHFTTTRFGWNYDSTTHNLYVGSGNNAEYLACEGSGGDRTLTLSYANGSYYNLSVDGTEIGWPSSGYYLRGTTDPAATVHMTNDAATDDHAIVSSGSELVTYASYNPGAYTLNVYDKTGTTVVGTASVSSTGSGAGTAIDLTAKSYGYNNDAIKFQITGLESGKQALVDVSVFMQALNPYIDQMNIICHDADNQLTLEQNFTAENFMVSGQKFNFYIPSEYSEADLNFTFSDLYSQYGDNTYYTGTALQQDGYARYSFVTSPYFQAVDQKDDNGLYNNPAYSPDASYVNKVYATKAGNIRFKFNNAEGLSNTNPTPNTNYLEEYAFTAARYVGSTDPDGGSDVGAFVDCEMNAQDTESSIYYLFTADETRYNIAPSTAWQHRYYAFYRMEIDLQTSTYDPRLTWTKVYNQTCYIKDGAEESGSMWGLKLNTVDHDTQAAMTGYLTVKQIDDAITADLGKNNCPTTADQILYIDGGDLYSIINSNISSGSSTSTMTLQTLKNKIATNALIYLPEHTTSILDNFAYKPTGWTTGTPYRAARDINITDKEPFYAPYDIQLDTDNKVYYERQVTLDKYGKAQNASLIMPFDILVDNDGIHTNHDGTKFSLHTMQSGNSLTVKDEELTAYFPVLTKVTRTEANKPYMVKLDEAQVPDASKEYSFLVSQKGVVVKATTGMASDYTYTSDVSTGTVTTGAAQGSYRFTPTGTYAGKYVPKTDNIFYFAKNLFWSSLDLNRENVSIYPFRAYYKAQSTSKVTPSSIQVFFGENEEDVDAILDLQEKGMDMSLRAGKGTITVAAAEDCNVCINGINGVSRHNLDMNAGETRTISVPAGVYVVNGVKILVK